MRHVRNMRMIVLIAFRNLVQAKRRTLFLSTALGLVTMLLVLLMALSQGISDNIIRSATTLTTGHINVAGFFKATPQDAAPLLTDFKKIEGIVKEATPDVDYAVSRHRGWSRVVSSTGALATLLAGVDLANEPRLLDVIELAKEYEYKLGGRAKVLGDAQRLRQPNTALIFASQAERLKVNVGDVVTLRMQTRSGRSNTIDVTIVAIAKDIGLLSNFSVFVPRQVILTLYQLKENTTGAIQVYLKDIHETQKAMSLIRQALKKQGYRLMEHQPVPFFAKFETVRGEDWVGQKIDITTWEDEVTFLTWILTALDTVSFGLVGILIVIIAIGVMNTMWISVRKRTREIGTLRAIGMPRSRVLAMFMSEALLLGLFASIMGAFMGALIGASVNALAIEVPVDAMRAILLSDTFVLSVTPKHFFGSILMLTTFTVLSALWPSIRGARLQPVEAIHQAE